MIDTAFVKLILIILKSDICHQATNECSESPFIFCFPRKCILLRIDRAMYADTRNDMVTLLWIQILGEFSSVLFAACCHFLNLKSILMVLPNYGQIDFFWSSY